MQSIIKENTALYHFLQWAFFPTVLVATPYVIYLLISLYHTPYLLEATLYSLVSRWCCVVICSVWGLYMA